jgi:hypothetical protein
LLLCPAYKGTLEFRSISPVFFCCLRIYISNLAKLNTARHLITILIIFLVNRSFFKNKLAEVKVNTVNIKKDVALIAVVFCVGFKVSLKKYLSKLNSLVAFCE